MSISHKTLWGLGIALVLTVGLSAVTFVSQEAQGGQGGQGARGGQGLDSGQGVYRNQGPIYTAEPCASCDTKVTAESPTVRTNAMPNPQSVLCDIDMVILQLLIKLMLDQKLYFRPNWMILGSSAVVMRPNWAPLMLLFGFRKLAWCKTLLASMRNSRVCASTTLNERANPKSTVQFPGPRSVARPAVPSVPRAGTTNASRLYHRHVGLLERRSVLHWLP